MFNRGAKSIRPFVVGAVSLLACSTLYSPASAQINVIAIAQNQFRNVSGKPAVDFHAEYNVPTATLGQPIPGIPSAPVGGAGLNANFDFPASPIASGDKFQITYTPGNFPIIFNNLIDAYFTDAEHKPLATKTVPIWQYFSFSPVDNSNEIRTLLTFTNFGSTDLSVSGFEAYSNLSSQYFTLSDFTSPQAIGTGQLINIPSSFVIPVGNSSWDFGSYSLGTFSLARGSISFDGSSFAFASAGLSTAVPEPASWAMMIVGFLFVGCAIRRGRKMRTRVALI